MARWMRSAAVAIALAAGSPALAESVATPVCERDLLVAESSLRQTFERLAAAGDSTEARCAAWRQHVEVLRRAADVYGRCLTGPEKTAKASRVNGRAVEFTGLIRERCGSERPARTGPSR